MKIHEFQAKELFQKYGVPIPRGKAAFSVEEAKKIGAELGTFPVVVKAQIHAGGRGKGGGVKLAKSAAEVDQYASSILGMTLVTHQTGPEGKLVKKLLIEEGLPIEKELYLSVLPDRGTAKIVFMASEAGGMDIEAVAASTPEKIIKVFIDPLVGMKGYHANELAYGLNLTGDLVKQFAAMATKLYKLCVDYDCSLVEINPMVLTKDGRVIALDGKINFDDNAIYRHKDIQEYRDFDEEDPAEVEASKYDLNYIKMPERQYRQHGKRRRPGHGDDGPHSAGGRGPGQLSGRRRRCERRTGGKRVPDHPCGPDCKGRAHQHFRRYPAVRQAG